ncbi:MAG: hypothetical protein A3I89_00135 [Candidatus Harrisonbacteria bacterium RIFCSPLOWO2_02_FULL_41_11]|uniref:Uncharacterized protein n=1 Tax=Candidatus Harrisonbacteria bacterium RIFCSPHIGHO2_02_FULL_42_16 TaxID=1798404 RepID=A0A1G1ZGF5_9BACT|nr:MAG: hypothetical protein A3B92_03250 [Candidatus Harrisonbacteria bacterium RIFCSPHIGHO2_02_FULL_42_16]OGY65767.1 MAG: hypothetical protein A3I89_00135 [Candidatus Harrisonbacteria bacterium RIFCSPLOWO2_02_FULL_41_11]
MDDGLHPQVRDLLDKSDGLDWLFMNKLKAGDVLAVRTCNTLYTMEVINSEKGEVRLGSEGRSCIPKDTPASVLGTTLTGRGTMVKIRGIAVGFRLMLSVRGTIDAQLILPLTQEVKVNGKRVLPLLQDKNALETQSQIDLDSELKTSKSPLVVKTRNSTYRFGAEDNKGKRTVIRDEQPLDFNRCKIVFLELQADMILKYSNKDYSWYTTEVYSIEKA